MLNGNFAKDQLTSHAADIIMVKCNICGGKSELLEAVTSICPSQSQLQEKPGVIVFGNAKLFLCPDCGHCNLLSEMSEDFYEEYTLSPQNFSTITELRKQQFNILTHGQKGGHLLDIGSGAGINLEIAKSYFDVAVGVEPSKTLCDELDAKGYNVINDYFSSKIHFERPFDVFISTHVFEHLDDPVKVLSDVYSVLADDAVGLIEIPNGQSIIQNRSFYDLLLDHVNYFSALSLCTLAKKAGFVPICVQETLGGQYLEMYVRKVQAPEYNMTDERRNIIDKIIEQAKKYKTVSGYGASTVSANVIPFIAKEINIKYIFDSDKQKHNKYLSSTDLVISAPTHDKINESDVIIVFSAKYAEEIRSQIREQYDYHGDFIVI